MDQIIPLFKVLMNKDMAKGLVDTINSGFVGQGPRVKEFEQRLFERYMNKKCLTLSSGTHGLTLCLDIQGISLGDEIISSPLTCFATNAPILNCGAKIKWADIDPETLNISPDSIRKNITNETKGIFMVHWGGMPCELEEIRKIALENDLFVMEDGAHCSSSFYKGFPIGSCSHSDYCIHSYQAIKGLTTGDGGALFLRSEEDYEKAKLRRCF